MERRIWLEDAIEKYIQKIQTKIVLISLLILD